MNENEFLSRKLQESAGFILLICGEYVMEKQKRNITEFVKRAYKVYFGMKLGDHDKSWAPHIVCKTCVESLRGWTNGKLKLKFAVPMIWREPKNHFDDCYFCLNNMNGFNEKQGKKLGST